MDGQMWMYKFELEHLKWVLTTSLLKALFPTPQKTYSIADFQFCRWLSPVPVKLWTWRVSVNHLFAVLFFGCNRLLRPLA